MSRYFTLSHFLSNRVNLRHFGYMIQAFSSVGDIKNTLTYSVRGSDPNKACIIQPFAWKVPYYF